LTLFSSLQPFTAILPLLFVIAVSMVREGYEDYQRYKSDNQVNNSSVDILDISYTSFKLQSCKKWMDLHVGEIVVIKKNEEIPADLIVLSSSDENGEAFIQTSSLDGEKNLKQKVALHILVFSHLHLILLQPSSEAGHRRVEGVLVRGPGS
jgi:phospholipid-transporting ATPase